MGVDGPTPEAVRAALPFTWWDELGLQEATLQLVGAEPFRWQFGHWLRQSELQRALQEAQARLRPGDGEAAVRAYQQVLRQRPHDGLVRFRLGELLLRLGRAREAVVEFAELGRRYPGWMPFRLGLVSALEAAGDRAGAMAQRRAAEALDPGDPLLGGEEPRRGWGPARPVGGPSP